MPAKTYDINTTADTIGTTAPGEVFDPLAYTETDTDTVRVGVWVLLSEVLGGNPFVLSEGLDVESILDPSTSDAERSALVREIVASYPGVDEIIVDPVVTEFTESGAPGFALEVEASTIYGGEFTVTI